MTLPNLLSVSRLVFVPALLLLAWAGRPFAFLALLTFSLATDLADGPIARRRGHVTELGGRLDSWGDLATYLTVPVCAWWLWPDVIRGEAVSVVVVVISYTSTTALGFLRYRRLKSFHTWGGKLSATVLGAGALLLLAGVSPWPIRLAAVITVLSDLEEIAMMAVLPHWRPDVPSLWHALRDERAAAGR